MPAAFQADAFQADAFQTGGATAYSIAGSGGSTSTGSGALTLLAQIAGVGGSTSTGSGALTLLASIAGAGGSTSAGSGAFTTLLAIAGAGAATSAGSGAFTMLMRIAASGGATSAGSGALAIPGQAPVQLFGGGLLFEVRPVWPARKKKKRKPKPTVGGQPFWLPQPPRVRKAKVYAGGSMAARDRSLNARTYQSEVLTDDERLLIRGAVE